MRLTRETVPKVLNVNEGYQARTYFKSRNKEEENFYTIIGGVLQKRAVGKTSFGGSQYDETIICDFEQTRRFLRNNANKLNFNIA